ncbi:GNAT family N-acetyltransferase [Paenibacillus albus]|nr:GNAT family N-acetyltransferase [Paenibacillus albus]
MVITNSLFSSFPLIQTKRLRLRQMHAADANDVFDFYSDPRVMQHQDWAGPPTIEATESLIDSWNEAYTDRKLFAWGISQREEDKVIGSVILMPTRGTFDEVPQFPLSLGYDLHPDYWNKGITSEALNGVLDFSRKSIGFNRIQAEVLPENKASIRVLHKLGFHEEGVLKQYLMHEVTHKFLDVVMLALLLNS